MGHLQALHVDGEDVLGRTHQDFRHGDRVNVAQLRSHGQLEQKFASHADAYVCSGFMLKPRVTKKKIFKFCLKNKIIINVHLKKLVFISTELSKLFMLSYFQ